MIAAFAYGFRDMLEAALLIGIGLAVLIRLGRGNLAQALWTGAGAGVLLGFSIGTGLVAGNLDASGAGWIIFELALMGLSLVMLAGMALLAKRASDENGPVAWLAIGAGLFAALPQTLDLLMRAAGNGGGMTSLAALALGAAVGAGAAALVTLGLVKVRLTRPQAANDKPATGELATVRQRVD